MKHVLVWITISLKEKIANVYFNFVNLIFYAIFFNSNISYMISLLNLPKV